MITRIKNYLFPAMGKAERIHLAKELLNATRLPSYVATIVISLCEIFFIVRNMTRPYTSETRLPYLSCYVVLLIASLAAMGIIMWCWRDIDKRWRTLHLCGAAYAFMIISWALVVTRLDMLRLGTASPVLLMTILLCIPVCLYMHPGFYFLLETIACTLMILMMSRGENRAPSADIINFCVYYVNQTVIACVFMYTRLHSQIRNIQRVAALEREEMLSRQLAETNRRLAEEAKQLADTDSLTGMDTRRAMQEKVEAAFGTDLDPDLTAIVMDVNGLKQTNDTKGHAAGDELLCAAAACIRGVFSADAISMARMGGDEFAVLICISQEELTKRTRLLKNLFAGWQGTLISAPIVSIGCSAIRDHTDCNLQTLLAAADEDMYRDKEQYYREHEDQDRRRRK